MITIDNLTRRYGTFTAVDDVSFTIGDGEVVGLLGHNGAGKTTIMRMLTGFLEPTSGSIRVGELQIGRDSAAIQRRIGYLPENCPAWPEMTVVEFLEYQAALHDVPDAQRARAVAGAIGRTELKDKATQPIHILSRGYRQRVGVAQAILHRPDIVILDEPTNGLDPTQILHMRALIRELSRTATVIVSTHILQEVQAVCARVLILRAGRKVLDARLDELQRDERLIVTLDRDEAVAGAALRAIPGVGSVSLLGANEERYRYALDAPEALAPAISAAVYQAGFALYGLSREQRTLESLFAELNAADATPECAMLPKVLKIARKELTAFFASPAALLFLGAFLGVTLFVFFWVATFFERNLADVRPLFQWMPVMLIFLVAALTMRAWAEERRSGTLELLLTTPTSPVALVLGKFVGSMALVLIALMLTLPLPITVALLGPLDWGPVIGGYAAAIALAAAYAAIGLWISSRTDNQIVSLILTVVVAGAFYLIGSDTLTSLVGYRAGEWLRSLGAGSRFASITRGVLDLRDLYYYLSITAVFLALNHLSLEQLRWAGNPAAPGHRRRYWLVGLLASNVIGANLWLDQIAWARVDLTSGRLYTLSDSTRNYLAQLQEPLLIRGYFSAATHPLLAPLVPQLRDLLQEYAVAGGSRVHVEFVDPHDDPNIESDAGSRYGIRPVPFQVSSRYQASVVNSYFDVLVSYGDQYQVLDYRDLIDVKADSATDLNVELKNPEYALTSAIRKVLLSYQGSGSPFDTLREPVTFTGYISGSQDLPDQLQQGRTALDAALAEIQKEAAGKFKIAMRDPDKDAALAARLTRDYGFRPMVVSLLDNKPFWFYMTLGDSRQTEQVPLPAAFDQAALKSALEAAVKRFSPGFLKTVAVVSPQSEEPPGAQGGGANYSTLREALSNSVHWLDTDLKSGQVPPEADMLMVLDPVDLNDKQLFAIDQFLMQGGSIVLATAPTDVVLERSIIARPVKSGLEAWLSGYGISFGKGLVLDHQSGSLPIPVERNVGGFNIDEIELAKYPYIVDVRDKDMNSSNPITAGLDQLYVPWAAPVLIDASRNNTRKLTPLLRSSASSWVSDATDLLPDYRAYPEWGFASGAHTAAQPLAVMLEGTFDSAFKGKPSPLLADASAGKGADKNATPAGKAADPPSGASVKSANGSSAAAPPVVGSVIEHSADSARLIVVGSNSVFNDQVISLLGQASGSRYLKSVEFAQNILDWSLADQGLLSIRGREHFAHTLIPMTRSTQQFWEYLNYGLALGGLALVWIFHRRQRHRALARHLQLLQET